MDTNYFKDKVIAVTGGSEGIGRAIVEKLLEMGCKVATCGRGSDKLYQLQVANPNGALHTQVTDVSKETDCKQFIKSTIEAFGSIDVLINNAGITMKALFADTDIADARQMMEVNFWGTVYCTKYALPAIIKGKGDIVAISAIAGNRGLPGRSGFSASKWTLQGWMEALRTELLETGVNVMWISPWFTHSYLRNILVDKDVNHADPTVVHEAGMITVEECADKILSAIAKRKRSKVLTIRGHFTVLFGKLFPALADIMVRRHFYKNGELIR